MPEIPPQRPVEHPNGLKSAQERYVEADGRLDFQQWDEYLSRIGLTEEEMDLLQQGLARHPWAQRLGDVGAALERFAAREPDLPPQFGVCSDGAALFYAGEVNMLFGGHSSAKSWIALYTAKQAVEQRKSVLYIDFEDSTAKAVSRLCKMGANPALVGDYFHHLKPSNGVGPSEQAFLGALLEVHSVALVVIDTTGVALGMEKLDSNQDSDVAGWLARFPNFVAEQGACVLLIDHFAKTAKDTGNPGGSGRKVQNVSGAAYSARAEMPYGNGKKGRTLIRCEKDRNGTYAIGEEIARFSLDATGEDEFVRPAELERVPPRTLADLLDVPSEDRTAQISSIIETLDDLGLPQSAGYPSAARALAAIEMTLPKRLLEDALRGRKRGAGSGELPV